MTALFAMLLAATTAADPAPADAKPGPDYEHLKQLEWLIGDWEGDMVVPPGGGLIAGDAKPGTRLREELSFFWMDNKNYIGLRFRETDGDRVTHQGFEIAGVDPKSKKLVYWLFSILGGNGTGEWSRDGKTWKLKWSGTAADGSVLEGVSYMVPVDANTHTWQAKENKKNGVKGPDTPVVIFRRVASKPASTSPPAPAAAAAVSPAYAHLKVLEPLVGQWRAQGEIDGRPLTGDFECHWLPGNSALAWTAWLDLKGGGSRQYYGSGLFVWDGREKVLKEHVSVANGDTQLTILKPTGPNRVAWDRTHTAADGTTSREAFETTFTKDKITFTDSQRVTPDGKVLARDRNSVFTRVAPDPGAALGLPPLGDDPPTAKEYLDFWNKYFVGSWNVRILEGPLPGEAGVQTFRKAPNGAAILFHAALDGKEYFAGVGGYDPQSRAWKETLFLSDGGLLTGYLRVPRATLTGDPAGKTLPGVVTVARPDGTIEHFNARTDIIDRNTNRFTASPITVDGKTPPAVKAENKRQAK